MNDAEINAKLDDIKRLTPVILATILDIAHRTEQLSRLHATLKGNNEPDTLISSVVGMVSVELSGEAYLLAKRLEVKRAMETLAKQTSAFWNDVEAISGNSHLGKVSPRDQPMPNIDFASLLQQMNPAEPTFVQPSSSRERPRVVPRPPEKPPEAKGDGNAA